MRIFVIVVAVIFTALLTLLTQIGGVVFLVTLAAIPLIRRRFKNSFVRFGAGTISFVVLYLLTTFIVVPLIASRYGRVPLPTFESNGLKPRTIFTSILNRNYVRRELRDVAYEVSSALYEKFPGTTVNYLDAGFPFLEGYPLFPHLSHNDGRKLDIALLYKNKGTGKRVNDTPSAIGYGVYERPEEGEADQPFVCMQQGHWQYSIVQRLVPQNRKEYFVLDKTRTRTLCNAFTSNAAIARIFIEPHLKTRLHLTSTKVQYHGCHAVRHDDHVHVELK